jgi:hypothetical protein
MRLLLWSIALTRACRHRDRAVGSEMVEIKAGFSWSITSNLLGQTGFFDNFAVSFLPEFEPPCFDVQRAQRH